MKQNKLWVFDFDGTLATIGHNYHAARLDSDCEEMLLLLIEKFPGQVAVVSSRPLRDLEPRVPVPGLFLGGSGGLTWLLPGGEEKIFNSIFEKHLNKTRKAVLPKIKKLELLYGIDTENKPASCTLHTPHLSPQMQQYIFTAIRNLGAMHACEVFLCPEAVEIYFLPASIRLAVISNLCSLLALALEAVEITYAGDDGYDIPAMQWAQRHKGYVYTVGDTSLVAAGRVVTNPSQLAQSITRLCETPNSAAASAAA